MTLIPEKAGEGKPGLARIFNSILSHMAGLIAILQVERLKVTDLIEIICSWRWDLESESGWQVALKLLEPSFCTVGTVMSLMEWKCQGCSTSCSVLDSRPKELLHAKCQWYPTRNTAKAFGGRKCGMTLGNWWEHIRISEDKRIRLPS